MKTKRIILSLLPILCLVGCNNTPKAEVFSFENAFTITSGGNAIATYPEDKFQQAIANFEDVKTVKVNTKNHVIAADWETEERYSLFDSLSSTLRIYDNNCVKVVGEKYAPIPVEGGGTETAVSQTLSHYYYFEKNPDSEDLYDFHQISTIEEQSLATHAIIDVAVCNEELQETYLKTEIISDFVSGIFSDPYALDTDYNIERGNYIYSYDEEYYTSKVINYQFPYKTNESTTQDNYIPTLVKIQRVSKYEIIDGECYLKSFATSEKEYFVEDSYGNTLEEKILRRDDHLIALFDYDSNGDLTEMPTPNYVEVPEISFVCNCYIESGELYQTITFNDYSKGYNYFSQEDDVYYFEVELSFYSTQYLEINCPELGLTFGYDQLDEECKTSAMFSNSEELEGEYKNLIKVTSNSGYYFKLKLAIKLSLEGELLSFSIKEVGYNR